MALRGSTHLASLVTYVQHLLTLTVLIQLAANADIFVNDAFGTAHRAHASTEGVTKFLSPSVAGLLLQKELDYLDGAVKEPKRPFVAIVGGSKVSSKIGVIESLLEKTDKIILGCVQLSLYTHMSVLCYMYCIVITPIGQEQA